MSEISKHPLVPAERVNGTQVYSTAGEKFGHVEDLAIDKVTGKVAYAILSTGGFLGVVGERFQAIPWSMLDYEAGRRGYLVPLSPEQVRTAPSIDRTQLSGWDDTEARQSIFDYYGQYGATPYWV